MPCKYVVGQGALLQWALRSWAEVEPSTELMPLEIGQEAGYAFDLSAVADLRPSAEATVFVAWGEQFLNFRRFELMGGFKLRGYKLPPLRCKGAVIAEDVPVGENAFVGAGAIVGPGSRIGLNAGIGLGAVLGAGVQVGNSAWVANGVQIGAGVSVGAHSILGQGVVVAEGIAIGKQAILSRPGLHAQSLPDKTYLLARLERDVRVIDYSR